MAYFLYILEYCCRTDLKAAVNYGFNVPLWLPAQRLERFHLGSYQELPINDRPKEGFDAISVSDSEKQLTFGVVEGQSEFASEMGYKRGTIILIQGKYQLAVASSLKLVALLVDHVGP